MLTKYKKEKLFTQEESFFKKNILSLFFTKKGVITIIIMVTILLLIGVFINQKNHVKATWIWDLEALEESHEDVISFANSQGVNLIYLHVSFKEFDKENFQSFIKTASEEGIKVYALGGDPNWALTKNRGSLDELVLMVKEYNRQVKEEAMFQGIHVDIEPYLLPEWNENRDDVVNQWMNNIKHLTKQVKSDTELNISGDLPFWIDKVKIPGEKSRYISEWMISKLDSVTIMAYRDQTDGENGVKGIVSPLVEQAANRNKSVVVAVNVIKTDEGSHTTFYDNSLKNMEQELRILDDHFSGHPGFGGAAVHDYSYWETKR